MNPDKLRYMSADPEMYREELRQPAAPSTPAPAHHGVDCEKVPHAGDGYLHSASDDSPYEDDGVLYCGRCHRWIGSQVAPAPAQPRKTNHKDDYALDTD